MKIKSNLLPIDSWWSDEAEDASESVLSVSWQIMSCIASHPAQMPTPSAILFYLLWTMCRTENLRKQYKGGTKTQKFDRETNVIVV